MASQQIDINVAGKDNTKSAFDSVANSIKRVGKEAASAGSMISTGISRGANVASQSLSRLGQQASSTFSMIKAGASAASQSIGGMGSAVASLAGGFGALEMASMVLGGAMTKQFSQAELAMKVGNDRAKELVKTIGQIVAETPGDDTYMNQLLSGMIAKEQNLTNDQLRTAGFLASDYIIKSRSVGKTMLETQMDLKEYLLTGNTGQLERDSILKMQLDTLKGQGTVGERILALDKAMKAEGYAGLSQLDVMQIKWDTLKGKIQLAATTLGEKLLPPLEKIVEWILQADEATNGWSTMIGFAAAGVVLLGIALAPIVTATMSAYAAMKLYRIEAELAAGANKKNPGPPVGTSGGITQKISDWIGQLGGVGVGAGLMKASTSLAMRLATGIASAFTSVGGAIIYPAIWGLFQPGSLLSGSWSFDESVRPQIEKVKSDIGGLGAYGQKTLVDLQTLGMAIWNPIAGAARSAFASIMGAWNGLKSAISGGIRTAISIGTGAIDWARQKYNDLKNWIMSNPIVQRIVTIASSGASAVSNVVQTATSWAGSAWNWLTGARGPGDVKYQNYAGFTGRNPWQPDGTLAGNCVDMSMGLVSRFGGELVNGTWNGGLHTWWRAPDGKEYDPSRKALNNTWSPPNSRGPGDGSGVTYVFNAPVYGYDDFKAKVEQANNTIVSGVY